MRYRTQNFLELNLFHDKSCLLYENTIKWLRLRYRQFITSKTSPITHISIKLLTMYITVWILFTILMFM